MVSFRSDEETFLFSSHADSVVVVVIPQHFQTTSPLKPLG